jgi:hypothetical protein
MKNSRVNNHSASGRRVGRAVGSLLLESGTEDLRRWRKWVS